MSGRHNAAVPPIFVETIGIPHRDSSAPRMVVLWQTFADLYQAVRDSKNITKPTFGSCVVEGAAKTPPAPNAYAIGDFVAEICRLQAQARHKPSKNQCAASPFSARDHQRTNEFALPHPKPAAICASKTATAASLRVGPERQNGFVSSSLPKCESGTSNLHRRTRSRRFPYFRSGAIRRQIRRIGSRAICKNRQSVVF